MDTPPVQQDPAPRTDAGAATTFEIHPIAAIFPPMRESELEALVSDIRERGQLEPLWIFEGKIIDGRHRLLACQRLGIEPRTREWDGNGSLLEFVISLNLRRRHLKESQRAMIGARMMPQFEEDAVKRLATRRNVQPRANWPQGRSDEFAGKLLHVSRKSVQRACSVLHHGTPELIAAVDQSKLAVSTAAALSERPHSEQSQLLALGRRELLAALFPNRAAKKQTAALPVPEAAPTPKPEPPPNPKLDPAQQQAEETILRGFSAGCSKLSKTEHGFRLEFTDNCLDELCQAVRDRERFLKLLDCGVFMIHKKNSA